MIVLNNPNVYDDVANWWYHYYSKGHNKKLTRVRSWYLSLSDNKVTPDFENYVYDYGICHPQIGAKIVPEKSIILMKTTVGCSGAIYPYVPKCTYIVGYFRVKEIDRRKELIFMDPADSLLLLSNPIELNCDLAKILFPNKPKGYWENAELFTRRLGSTLRNRMAKPNEIRIVLSKLLFEYEKGAVNYLGEEYSKLITNP